MSSRAQKNTLGPSFAVRGFSCCAYLELSICTHSDHAIGDHLDAWMRTHKSTESELHCSEPRANLHRSTARSKRYGAPSLHGRRGPAATAADDDFGIMFRNALPHNISVALLLRCRLVKRFYSDQFAAFKSCNDLQASANPYLDE